MSKKRKYPLSRPECICGICREILLEPVTLPCDHTLCHPCFRQTVEKASLCCPYCRHRVSNWARKNARSGTLVDKELWEIIQRQYPEECERRARGLDSVEDDFEDGFISYPAPLICKPGEIRQEYEAEITKIEAERLSREEEERKKSEEYIRRLLAEEEEEQRLHQERAQRQLEDQLKRDEELARMLNTNMNESFTSDQSSIIEVPVASKQTPSSKSSKNVKAKPKPSGDIERFLSPKVNESIHIRSSAQIRSEDLKHLNSTLRSNGSVLDSDEDSMPSLSPQFSFSVNGRKMHASDTELPIPCLSKYSPIDAAQSDLHLASSSEGLTAKLSSRNKTPSDMAAVNISPPMSSSDQGDGGWWSSSESSNVTSTPDQWIKTAKRTLESPVDGDSHVTEKRQKVSCLENNSVAELYTERIKEQEEALIQRKLQEEQDRMMALKLQKLLDKEESRVSRHKGSPDEYKLRPKRTSQQQETSDTTPQKKSQFNDGKAESPGSEDTSDENKKPPKKSVQRNRVGHSSRTQLSEGLKVLRPSNKQQTILDMFQKSAGK
ncbi:E3 ubiquitin-protein ligase RNF168 [Bufo gargarizans]|uniref:E3 ubiquitin-protein ligase RNF168 n=1 Tax=Bufo gargarizans TaxID=30331 RepID=UPI001CF16A24|nr:E3 ubiquitin-protein ligase RNF168 [Bufo gargarizans]XP_044144571.1 E3 ubiquitin-protein ligase RNF168 [Bufo gargarizans]